MVESILKFIYLFLPYCKRRYNVNKRFFIGRFYKCWRWNWETTPILFEGYRRSNLHFISKIQKIKCCLYKVKLYDFENRNRNNTKLDICNISNESNNCIKSIRYVNGVLYFGSAKNIAYLVLALYKS